MVVFVVIVECLTHEIQAVQLMQTLNVSWVASAVFWVDSDLIGAKTCLCCTGLGDCDAAVFGREFMLERSWEVD